MIWNLDAPVALSASIDPASASSIVSMKARVRKPRLLKNRARKPVNSACLKEKRRMKPHATVGMLRSTVANARMTI